MVSILAEPKNSLVRQYKKLFSYEVVELVSTDAALHTIAATALEQGTGARGLRAIMENLLRPYMYEIPSNKAVAKCIIDVDADNHCIVDVIESEAEAVACEDSQ